MTSDEGRGGGGGTTNPSEDHTSDASDHAEKVFLPLDLGVGLAGFLEQTVLHDSDGREELQGRREQDGNRVEALRERNVVQSVT